MSLLDKAKEMATTIADKTTSAGHAAVGAAEAAASKVAETAHQVGTSIAGGATTVADQASLLAHSAADVAKNAGSAALSTAEKVTGIDLNKDGKIG